MDVLVGVTGVEFTGGSLVWVGGIAVLVAVGGMPVEVGVGERTRSGVGVVVGSLVGLLSSGWVTSGTGVLSPVEIASAVGVGDGISGVICAMPAGPPVSGGGFIPIKSCRISRPIAGTETGSSSTP
jgi:hypothetical protein